MFFSLNLPSRSTVLNIKLTRRCISFTFDPRDVLSLQIGFSFVRAAETCSILERTSGFQPSSETTTPRYLELVTVLNFFPFILNLHLDVNDTFCHQFGRLSTDLHLTPWADEKHHNQIGCILVRKRFRSGVNFHRTRSFPGADIGSDHDLVIMTFRVRLKKVRKPNQPRLRFDLDTMRDPDVACTF